MCISRCSKIFVGLKCLRKAYFPNNGFLFSAFGVDIAGFGSSSFVSGVLVDYLRFSLFFFRLRNLFPNPTLTIRNQAFYKINRKVVPVIFGQSTIVWNGQEARGRVPYFVLYTGRVSNIIENKTPTVFN